MVLNDKLDGLLFCQMEVVVEKLDLFVNHGCEFGVDRAIVVGEDSVDLLLIG